jgi:hypothetical protein
MTNKQLSSDYLLLSSSLEEICKKLTELSNKDFSNIHVDQAWSWMPYVKDHIQFLLEQTDGLLQNLKDVPPPVQKTSEQIIIDSSQ